jgi:hypothetical protein
MQEQKPPSRKKLPDTEERKKELSNYARYSSMGLQMAVTIGAGIYGGMKLDQYTHWVKFPVFTVCLSLLSIFAAMYLAIRKILKK